MKKNFTKVLSLALVVLMLTPLFPVMAEEELDLTTVMTAETYTTVDKSLTMPYRMYVPENYDEEKEYALLVFLHGAGNRGDNNTSQIAQHNTLLKRIISGEFISNDYGEFDTKDEFIIIAPQCGTDAQWVDTPWDKTPDPSYNLDEVPASAYMNAVMELIDHTIEKKSVDLSRIYAAGLSMGGFGVWDLLMRNPKMFAAAIPMAGAGDPTKAELIKHVPIWTFHQALDTTVSAQGTYSMVEALMNVGGNVKLTQYFDNQHNAWEKGFAEKDLLSWLCNQKKTPDVKVACIGASNTNSHAANRKYYPEYLDDMLPSNVEVRNYGHSGSTALTSTDRPYINTPQYKDALEYAPDVLLIKFGGNDAKDDNWERGSKYFYDEFSSLVDSFKAVNPDVKVYVVLSSRAFRDNVLGKRNSKTYPEQVIPILKDYAAKNGCEIIDFFNSPTHDREDLFPDYLHANAEASEIHAGVAYEVLSKYLPTEAPATESPVKNAADWAKKELSFLCAQGLGLGTFDLNYTESITREDFCKAIVSAIPKSTETVREAIEFTDTKDKAVIRAYTLGIVNGMSDTEFAPTAKITREQAAAMLQRAYHLIAPGATAENAVEFKDAASISGWATESVGFISGIGIMKGDDQGNMNPLNNITYQEALLTVYRTYMSANTYGK